MLRKSLLFSLGLLFWIPAALIGADGQAAALTAEQIVLKNVEARGGLNAWRGIQAMTMTGKMDAGSKQNAQLPFVMSLKRPRMSRLEIEFQGKTAVQVYDGTNGWKVRPFLNRSEVEPFTPDEMKKAEEQQDLDGLLIDHEAKGIKVELAGTEQVEGKDAYKLKLTMKNGNSRHLWVDAQSFLEVKLEGFPRKLDGKMHKVEVWYRNYGSIGGMMIPFELETVVEGKRPSRKITIEKVLLNPKLEDSAFAKPEIPGAVTPAAFPQQKAVQIQPANLIPKGESSDR
jgi:outer membrane lipoprotein-sorting protein